jgi:hypothetical protein
MARMAPVRVVVEVRWRPRLWWWFVARLRGWSPPCSCGECGTRHGVDEVCNPETYCPICNPRWHDNLEDIKIGGTD